MFLEFLQVDQPHRAREEGFWRTHVGERLTTADLVPPRGVPYGSSSSFVLPLGFRVLHIMVAGAGPGVRLVGTGGPCCYCPPPVSDCQRLGHDGSHDADPGAVLPHEAAIWLRRELSNCAGLNRCTPGMVYPSHALLCRRGRYGAT